MISTTSENILTRAAWLKQGAAFAVAAAVAMLFPPAAVSQSGGSGMEIFIKPLTGSAFTLTVDAFDTVLSVKERIQSKIGTAVDKQRLVFNGVTLENTKTLADYKVQKESTLHMALPLRTSASAAPAMRA